MRWALFNYTRKLKFVTLIKYNTMLNTNIIEVILGVSALFVISFLGLTVYLRNPRSYTNRLFLALTIVLDTYVITNFLSLHPPLKTPENQLFWIRVVMSEGSFIGPALFLLVHTFPHEKITLAKKYLVALGAIAVTSAVMSMMDLVFKAIEYPGGMPLPIPGWGMVVFFADFIGLFALSFIVLILKYRRTFGEEKLRHLHLLLGVLVSFSLMGISSTIAVAILKNSAFVFLSPIYPVILSSFIAYAIIKHRFLDIQPIIARTVSYLFLIVIIAAVYILALFLGTVFIAKTDINLPTAVISAVVALVAALTFQPLQALIRKLTDKIFFKGLYNSEQLLADLMQVMSETLDLDVLTQQLLSALIKEMRLTKAAFIILDDHNIIDVKSIGYDSHALVMSPLEGLIHKELRVGMRSFIFQDLTDEGVKALFRQYGVEILIPIKVDKKEVAILVAGPKAAGDIYSKRDINFIEVLASEAGIAIQNATLFSDLKKASESKSRFISVVSHQLRTPVSGIRWSLEMLKQEPIAKKEREEFLGNAYQGVVFLSEQLDDILTALDIYDRKIFIKKEDCNLTTICNNIVLEFMTAIKTKQLAIDYAIDPDAHLVQADPIKLEKVMKILIKNAIVYSPNGGRIKISSRFDDKNNRRKTVVSISDEGIGIAEDERDHVFEQFFRSDKARTALPNGLGLGTFIAQAFIKAQGGDMWFFSKGRNQGADFHFSLPVD